MIFSLTVFSDLASSSCSCPFRMLHSWSSVEPLRAVVLGGLWLSYLLFESNKFLTEHMKHIFFTRFDSFTALLTWIVVMCVHFAWYQPQLRRPMMHCLKGCKNKTKPSIFFFILNEFNGIFRLLNIYRCRLLTEPASELREPSRSTLCRDSCSLIGLRWPRLPRASYGRYIGTDGNCW